MSQGDRATAARPFDAGVELELLPLLVECVMDYAIFLLDPSGHVASWNSGAARTKGYSAEEIIGKHFSVFYPEEEIAAGKCERELEIAKREGRFEEEGWRLRKDGTTFWANVVITAIRDKEGRLRGFGKVTRDLTLRLRAERERIERARVEERERRKGEFLSIMGHELRNPLAPMLTAVHLIKVRRGLNCDREIAVLERQLGHAIRLLDDLADMSRILRDKIDLATEPTEISSVLADAVDASAPLITKKGQKLRLDIASDPLVVDVDSDRMSQVFANLLNNASKYTDPGGTITVHARGDGDEVRVSIEDTGAGIEAGALDTLFDLFTQAPAMKDRGLGGFGIGLAVARRLVTAHGGTIAAESEGSGCGSRFIVTLRRSTRGISVARPTRPSLHRVITGRRVLLVDDNQDSVDMAALLLGELGHDVRTALDGLSALSIVAEGFRPDIAFLDLGLPGMDGFELVRHLRKIAACATIPVIAASGYTSEADRRRALEAGFTGHIPKPFDPERMERMVASSEGELEQLLKQPA